MTPFFRFFLLSCLSAFCSAAATAQDRLRVATWHVELSRDGPGLLLRDIASQKDPEIEAAQKHIQAIEPDILLLTGFDTDLDGATLRAFNTPLNYPYQFTQPGNSGRRTGLDLDKDGRTGEPEDAQSYGTFTGQGGLALLSKHPIDEKSIRDFSSILWRDIPGAHLPEDYFQPEDLDRLRLASHAHWDVPILWSGQVVHLLAFAATAPVFDGQEDRNGHRNADEIRLWQSYLDGTLEHTPPAGAFIIMGNANLDPQDGDGIHTAIQNLLTDPRLTDPMPRGTGDVPEHNTAHLGDPALDTANWRDPNPGNLRVDYVLPSRKLRVIDSGVSWSQPYDDKTSFRHGLVWVDIASIP